MGSHILVKVGINRYRGHYFVVDTGASATVVDSNLKGLKDMTQPEDVQSYALSDEMLQTRFCLVDKFYVGDVLFPGTFMAALDLSGLQNMYKRFTKVKISGLLGGDFLSLTEAVIDYKKQTLSFLPVPPLSANEIMDMYDNLKGIDES